MGLESTGEEGTIRDYPPVVDQQHYSLKTKPSVLKNGQNDLGDCRDQIYHFQHQSKVTAVWPKQGAIPYRAWPAILDKHKKILLCFISIDYTPLYKQ